MKGLVDSTLREGAQAYGLSFGLEEKKTIFLLLAAMGVEEVELGIASASNKDLPRLVSYCRNGDYSGRLGLWCLCRETDIRHAAGLMPDVLSLSIPASDLHIEKKLGKSRDWILETVHSSVGLARGLGFPVISLGLEDATRADRDFLEAIVRTACNAGIHRVRLADTVGIATAGEVASLVGKLKASCECELGVHAHNDFGMATANSLAALDAGAQWADVTVLGIGERAGNARLEELAGFLTIRRNRDYDLKIMKQLTREVSRLTKQRIAPGHPVVGETIFHCETGLHLQGLEQEPATYEPFPPELVGASRMLHYGEKIGRRQRRNRMTAGNGAFF